MKMMMKTIMNKTMKKKVFLTMLVLMLASVLVACGGNSEDTADVQATSTSTTSMRDEVATRRNFLTIGELFNFVNAMANSEHSSWGSVRVLRVEVLDERPGYIYNFGTHIPRLFHHARVLDVFYGYEEVGDIIEIDRSYIIPDQLTVGDDIVLFLSVPSWTEGRKMPDPQGIFRTPPQLSYPQSIISSILTRTIPEDMILEPTRPDNPLSLTIQDLARIAGLCDSPWPQPVIYRTVTFTPNANEALLPGFIPTGGMVRANTNPYQILPRGRITIGAEGEPIQPGSSHREGTEIIFRATPDRGASLQAWYINGIRYTGGTPSSITLTLESNLDVRAVFGVVGGFIGDLHDNEDASEQQLGDGYVSTEVDIDDSGDGYVLLEMDDSSDNYGD